MNKLASCALLLLHFLSGTAMADEFRYQLVLQWKTTNREIIKDVASTEEGIQRALGKTGLVDGHDFGAGTLNIFIDTNKPQEALTKVTKVLKAPLSVEMLVAAYRDYDGEKFTVIWPPNYKGRFDY